MIQSRVCIFGKNCPTHLSASKEEGGVCPDGSITKSYFCHDPSLHSSPVSFCSILWRTLKLYWCPVSPTVAHGVQYMLHASFACHCYCNVFHSYF